MFFNLFLPIRFWKALAVWLGLGLGTKPEERPEVEEGERDGAALLLGVLKGLLEVEQSRAWSCGEERWDYYPQSTGILKRKSSLNWEILPIFWIIVHLTSLLPPLATSFFAGVCFAGAAFCLGRLSGCRLILSTYNKTNSLSFLCSVKTGLSFLKIGITYLLVPSLPPLLSRHGWGCAHRVWVKVVMKLVTWILEDKKWTRRT